MSKRRHTAEQIIGKLREAEVQLAQSIPQKYIDEIRPPDHRNKSNLHPMLSPLPPRRRDFPTDAKIQSIICSVHAVQLSVDRHKGQAR